MKEENLLTFVNDSQKYIRKKKRRMVDLNDILKRFSEMVERYIPRAIVSPKDQLFIDHAEGATITTIDGKRYIDFVGNIGVMNVGHNNPEVLEKIRLQLQKYVHSNTFIAIPESFLELAKKLTEITPGNFDKKVMFLNSGAEAVENAVKFAKAYNKRSDIIVFENSFHGRTNLTLAMTSKSKPLKTYFGPYPSGIYRLPFCYCYRCHFGLEYPSCNLRCANYVDEALQTWINPEEVSSLVVEPIQGEGGFITPVEGYFEKIREICNKYNIVLIIDEIQSGYARTGKMFGIEHWGIDPDLMTLGKSIAAGIPLTAVVGKKEIMDAPSFAGVGTTFGGNALGCAAGLEVINQIEKQNLVERSKQIGKVFYNEFINMKKKYNIIGEVRGKGAMVAMELVKNRTTKEPATTETGEIIHYCQNEGLLLFKAGAFNNVIRILAPLVITDKEMEEGLAILEKALQKVSNH